MADYLNQKGGQDDEEEKEKAKQKELWAKFGMKAGF